MAEAQQPKKVCRIGFLVVAPLFVAFIIALVIS
jgi:hypothetical protein